MTARAASRASALAFDLRPLDLALLMCLIRAVTFQARDSGRGSLPPFPS